MLGPEENQTVSVQALLLPPSGSQFAHGYEVEKETTAQVTSRETCKYKPKHMCTLFQLRFGIMKGDKVYNM